MRIRVFLFLLAAMTIFSGEVTASVWYVDAGAAPGGDGTSWATAVPTVQDGINAAAPADEVWVKAGTYLLAAQIAVDEQVGLYGGFDGTEALREERDWMAHVTTIDGNNAVRCLFVTADNVTLDGFVITQGYTDPAASISGAGMLHGVVGTEIHTTLANCTFLNNHSGRHAGAISSDEGDLVISNCAFTGNTAANRGAALSIYASGNTVTISASQFVTNTGGSGGALYVSSASGLVTMTDAVFDHNHSAGSTNNDGGAILCDAPLTLTGCVFVGNTATRHGTLATRGDVGKPWTITNCLFAGNSAVYGAGVDINGTSGFLGSMVIAHCTFAGNVATGGGGAIYNLKALDASSVFTVTNSILWGDTISEIGGTGGTPTVSYSDVQGGYAGTGNLDQDPLFVSGGLGDFYLSQVAAGQGLDSPCVDAGDPAAADWGWRSLTTRTDQEADAEPADMGYHYSSLCTDSDGDTYAVEGGACGLVDCDDSDADVYPGAVEACNGIDDDCDLDVDEANAQGCAVYSLDEDGDTYGVTGDVQCLCAPEGGYTAVQDGDCLDTDPDVNPGAVEECGQATCTDTLDNDCDGVADAADADCAAWCPAAGQSSMLERMDPAGSHPLGPVLLLLVPGAMIGFLRAWNRKR